jgi:hypothetical protein
MTTKSDWITAHRAAKALGRKHTTIKLWARHGLQHRMAGPKLLVRLSDVEAFAESRKRKTPFVYRHADDPTEAGTIYAWKHPCTGEIRYVGKAKDLHCRLKSYRHKVHSPHLQHWMDKLRAGGLEPELMILQECKSHLSGCERWWIAHGRACGWRLINKTDGGEGYTELAEDVRARLSQKSKEKWADPEYRKRWRESMAKAGRLLTNEQRQAMDAKERAMRLMRVAWRAWTEPIRAADVERMEASRARLARRIVVDGNIARVPLTHGRFALINTADADRVGRHLWSLQVKGGYERAKTNGPKVNGKAGLLLLNRFVMNAGKGEMVRHRNGDQLDCRRANLIVTNDKIETYDANRTSRVPFAA